MADAQGTFWTGKNPDAEAKPINDVLSSGSYRDIPGDVFHNAMNNFYQGKASAEDTAAILKGTPKFNPSIGPQYDAGNGMKPLSGPATGMNAPGQGFYTPEVLSNQAKAISDHLEAISTKLPPEPGVPSRNNPPAGAGDVSGLGTGTPGTPVAPTVQGTIDGMRSSFEAANGLRPTLQPTDTSGVNSAEDDLAKSQANLTAIENQILGEKNTIMSKTAGLTRVNVGQEIRSVDAETAQALASAKAEVTNSTNLVRARTAAVNFSMRANQQSYADAASAWDKEYASALATYKANNAAATKEQNQTDATIKTFVGQFKGKTNFTLTPDLKARAEQLDAQGGHEIGYTEGLIKLQEQGVNIGYTTVSGGTTYVHATTPDGTPVIYKINPTVTNPKPSSGTPNVSRATDQMEGFIKEQIKNNPRSDNYLSPQEWAMAKQEWVKQGKGYTSAQFNSLFGGYKNPDKTQKYD